MSKERITPNKTSKIQDIFSDKSGSLNNWKITLNGSNNETIETTIKSQVRCTCNKNISKSKKQNLKKKINIYTNEEKHLMSTLSENVNSVNTTISNNSLQVQITESDDNEKNETREGIYWSISDLFIQVMERLQYLAAEPPQLYVQFPTDLMIERTINNNPIRILIPIPDNYIQQQDHFEVIAKEVEKVKTQAKFGYLAKDQFEMFIKDKKIEIKQPLVQENHNLNIPKSQRMWKGPIQPVKTNKIIIQDAVRNWNNLIKQEKVKNLEFKGEQKIKKEIIKPKPQYSLSEESKLSLGGKGFKPKVWTPIPNSVHSFMIEREPEPEPEIISESVSESFIINDDYNQVKNLKMRPVFVTVMKMNEEEEASTEALDIMESIFSQKINLNIDDENNFIKSRFEFNEKIEEELKYEINFISKNKKFNGVRK
jgi:hypothetical protein